MIPTRVTTIPIFPSTHVRVIKKELWLLNETVTEDYLQQLDQDRIEKINPKTGLPYGKPGGYLRRARQLRKNYAFKVEMRTWVEKTGFKLPDGYFAMWFYIPMPPSWRKKKREEMIYTEHKGTPDIDNLVKAALDALHPRRNRIAGDTGADDRRIHTESLFKVWVPYDEACIKVVEYDREAYMFEFRHGHPTYDSNQEIMDLNTKAFAGLKAFQRAIIKV